jgi:pathogenesis-related protein 1
MQKIVGARLSWMLVATVVSCVPAANPPPGSGGGGPAPGAGDEEPFEKERPEETEDDRKDDDDDDIGDGDDDDDTDTGHGDDDTGDDDTGDDDTGAAKLTGDPAAYVAEHNRYRAAHCAPPLTWSDKVAASAQAWADALQRRSCAFEHSNDSYGENLAAATPGTLSPADVVEMWYREVDEYDFRRPDFSMTTGHFTQLVWADTRHIGCGVSACKNLEIFVCQYDPPGNVMGDFERNVQPTGCR